MEETGAVQTIGRYHVLQELGRGGMAVVYKGFDPLIGRTVALKTIAFGVADATVTDLRQRLYREACAAGTLTHPNIVTIYDVIEMGGATAVAMEFIEGRTLADVIEERAPMQLDAALGLFEQICAALDYAGGRDIVHRDIKPANVMITPEGRVKVADFGVARIGVSHLTQSGAIVGSPSYMSPEQVRGLSLDTRSDLFSATVVLYEMLTKERPFSGSDVATTMYRIVHEPPTPPTQFNPTIDPTVVSVFERGLAKEPGQRYRSGAEMCRDLRQALSAAPLPPTVEVPASDTGPINRKGLMLGIAAAGVAVVAGALLVIGRTEAPPGPEQQTTAQTDVAAATTTTTGSPALPGAPSGESRGPAATTSTPAGLSVPQQTAAQTGPVVSPAVGVPSTAPAEVPPVSAPVAPVSPPPTSPAAAEVASAEIQVSFEGDEYPVTVYADGRDIGRLTDADGRLSVQAGRVRLRLVNESLFLDQNVGSLTLRSRERRRFTVPAVASASVVVKSEIYGGLRIVVDGRTLPGPYPAQVPRISAGLHKIVFRWSETALAGVEVADTIDLSGGRVFLIRAVPENAQVVVQKLR